MIKQNRFEVKQSACNCPPGVCDCARTYMILNEYGTVHSTFSEESIANDVADALNARIDLRDVCIAARHRNISFQRDANGIMMATDVIVGEAQQTKNVGNSVDIG